jgi:hypothetical protein
VERGAGSEIWKLYRREEVTYQYISIGYISFMRLQINYRSAFFHARRIARAGMVLFTTPGILIAVMNTAEMVLQDPALLGRLT